MSPRYAFDNRARLFLQIFATGIRDSFKTTCSDPTCGHKFRKLFRLPPRGCKDVIAFERAIAS